MDTDGKPKFILIDHSIRDIGGHYYEYAVRVLEAAEQSGYAPVLAVNRQFKQAGRVPWPTYPLYRYEFFFRVGHARAPRAAKALGRSIRNGFARVLFHLVYSRVGMLWYNRRQQTEFLRRTPRWTLVGLLPAALFFYGLRVGEAATDLVRSVVPFRDYAARVLRSAGRLFRALLQPALAVLYPSDALRTWLATVHKGWSFGQDTVRLLRKVRVETGDLVFIPTLAEAEMLGLLDCFRRQPRSRLASWHLLFRRNIYTGRDADYAPQDEALRPLRNAFAQFRQAPRRPEIYFYTDTEQLTTQHNRLGAGRFRTAPIPVGAGYQAPPSDGRPRRPLRVLYTGDARVEKGYHHLPRLVRDLWADQVETGRMAFTFQSNLSADAEPKAVVARAQLECLPSDKVQLLPDPLTPEEYRELVLSGDIMLVLYDTENYYARSSGIFVEALAAGIPVVAPAGTWMSIQLAETLHEYHAGLREALRSVWSPEPGEVAWHIHGRGDANPAEGDRLEIIGRDPTYCWLTVPRGGSHLLLTFRQSDEARGRFVRVFTEQLAMDGASLGRGFRIVGGGPRVPGSVLLPVEPGAARIWLGLSAAYSPAPLALTSVRLDFLRSVRSIPLSTVGALYSTEEEIPDCLRELSAHYDHYRRSAGRFAEPFRSYHNAACLVRHLADAAAPGRAGDPLPEPTWLTEYRPR